MVTRQKNSRSLVEGKTRKKPGSTGQGDYYHVEVAPKSGFVTFRTQDVGKRGHLQRVAGKKETGQWVTVKWLIGKEDAHVRGKKLIPDTKAAKNLIEELGVQPVQIIGDRFTAKQSISEKKKTNRKKSKKAKS
jgi:hypothetical protein